MKRLAAAAAATPRKKPAVDAQMVTLESFPERVEPPQPDPLPRPCREEGRPGFTRETPKQGARPKALKKKSTSKTRRLQVENRDQHVGV